MYGKLLLVLFSLFLLILSCVVHNAEGQEPTQQLVTNENDLQ